MSNIINDLIGEHPKSPNFFAEWLNAEDKVAATNPNKKHRQLKEIDGQRENAIKQIAQILIEHLIHDHTIRNLRRCKKEAIYGKYNYEQHLQAQDLLSKDKDTAQQGNFAEIIFVEYLKSLGKYNFLVYKLHYNPNVSQSMKGDDILMFNKDKIEDILLGESKYRSTATAASIEDILESFGGKQVTPISLTFIANHIEDTELSYKVMQLQTEIKAGDKHLLNVGLILSTKDIHRQVENHNLYGDYALNQKTLDKLQESDAIYPVNSIKGLIGQTYNAKAHLWSAIEKSIIDSIEKEDEAKKEVKKKKEDLKANAKKWLNNAFKKTILENCDKQINPSLLFISLGLDDLDIYLQESFRQAEQLLQDPDSLPIKKEILSWYAKLGADITTYLLGKR